MYWGLLIANLKKSIALLLKPLLGHEGILLA